MTSESAAAPCIWVSRKIPLKNDPRLMRCPWCSNPSRRTWSGLVFKGGSALRKLYAGNHGHSSTDLDFSRAGIADDPDDVVLELIAAIDGSEIGPLRLQRAGA